MERVRFTQEKATMLATLYCRALDAQTANPLLGDRTAEASMAKIDFDFDSLGVTPDMAVGVVGRAKLIDTWVSEILAEHPELTVLHLGCGMDSRVFRLDPPASVEWFDVDYPEVVALRKQIYPDREHYHVIGSSVTDPEWLTQIPADRPVLVVAEGLMMYLPRIGGEELLKRIIAKFPSGEMIFDSFSSLINQALNERKTNPVMRNTNAIVEWSIDDLDYLEGLGLKDLTALVRWRARPEFMSRFSRRGRYEQRVLNNVVPSRRRKSRGNMLVRGSF
jgi:O-methyltransferase involved in polyketide biosynthesis